MKAYRIPLFYKPPTPPEIEADIAIKTFQLPNLEINDLSTRLMADKHPHRLARLHRQTL